MSKVINSPKNLGSELRAQDIKVKDKGKITVDEDVAEFIASRVESRVSEEMARISNLIAKIIRTEIRTELRKEKTVRSLKLSAWKKQRGGKKVVSDEDILSDNSASEDHKDVESPSFGDGDDSIRIDSDADLSMSDEVGLGTQPP